MRIFFMNIPMDIKATKAVRSIRVIFIIKPYYFQTWINKTVIDANTVWQGFTLSEETPYARYPTCHPERFFTAQLNHSVFTTRLLKKQGDGQIALNSVFLGHHGFRLKHIDNFDLRIFFKPPIDLQFSWRIYIGRTIAENLGPNCAHMLVSVLPFWEIDSIIHSLVSVQK